MKLTIQLHLVLSLICGALRTAIYISKLCVCFFFNVVYVVEAGTSDNRKYTLCEYEYCWMRQSVFYRQE